MDLKKIDRIFEETAYIRTGGSDAEKQCAEYLIAQCAELGLKAELEPFEVDMATIHEAKLIVDGEEIPCKGYLCAGDGDIEAELYYLNSTGKYALSQCKGKIVMIDGYLGY